MLSTFFELHHFPYDSKAIVQSSSDSARKEKKDTYSFYVLFALGQNARWFGHRIENVASPMLYIFISFIKLLREEKDSRLGRNGKTKWRWTLLRNKWNGNNACDFDSK